MRSHVDIRPQNGTWHKAQGSPQMPACVRLADPGSLLNSCLSELPPRSALHRDVSSRWLLHPEGPSLRAATPVLWLVI